MAAMRDQRGSPANSPRGVETGAPAAYRGMTQACERLRGIERTEAI